MRKLLIISLLIVLLGACTRENYSNMEWSGDGVDFALQFKTRANVTDEYKIEKLRVVVVAKSNGLITCNQTFTGEEIKREGEKFSVVASARPGESVVYVIANEPIRSGYALDAMTTSDDLKKITINFKTLDALDADYGTIPMMGHQEYDITVVPEQNNVDKIQLERLLAKVSLQFKAGAEYISKVKITSIQLCNAPKYSYLLAGNYPEEIFAATNVMPYTRTEAITGVETTAVEFYAPEYILVNDNLFSYIEVKGSKVEDGAECTYKIPLHESVVTGGGDGSYNVNRNSHYTIVGTIQGYGKTDLSIDVKVSPWADVESDSNVGTLLYLKSMTDTDGTPIADADRIPATGQTIRFTCRTNVGEWYIITHDEHNNLIHKSAATSLVTSPADQQVEVILPASEVAHQYIIKIYHAKYAPEKRGPFRTIFLFQGVQTAR